MTPRLLSLAAERTRWLVTSPATLAGLVTSLVLVWTRLAPWAPVLHRDAATTAVSLWPLAAGGMVAAAWLAHRPRFDGTEILEAVAPVTKGERSRAIVISALAVGSAAGVLAALIIAVRAVTPDAIGVPVAWDLLGLVAAVAVAVLVGDVIGSRLRSLTTVLLGVASVVTIFIALSAPRDARSRLGMMADWARLDGGMIELLPRDPALHTLMVVLVLAGMAGWFGLTRAWLGRVVFAVSLAGAGLVAALLLGSPWDGRAAATAKQWLAVPDSSCVVVAGREVCGPEVYVPWAVELVEQLDGLAAVLDRAAGPSTLLFTGEGPPRRTGRPPIDPSYPPARQRDVVAVNVARPAGIAGSRWEVAVLYALAWSAAQQACLPDDGHPEWVAIGRRSAGEYGLGVIGNPVAPQLGCHARGTLVEVQLLLAAASVVEGGAQVVEGLTSEVPFGWHPGGSGPETSPYSRQFIDGAYALHDVVGDYGAGVPGVTWDEGWRDAVLWDRRQGELILSRQGAEVAAQAVRKHGLDGALQRVEQIAARHDGRASLYQLADELEVDGVPTLDASAASAGLDPDAVNRAIADAVARADHGG